MLPATTEWFGGARASSAGSACTTVNGALTPTAVNDAPQSGVTWALAVIWSPIMAPVMVTVWVSTPPDAG